MSGSMQVLPLLGIYLLLAGIMVRAGVVLTGPVKQIRDAAFAALNLFVVYYLFFAEASLVPGTLLNMEIPKPHAFAIYVGLISLFWLALRFLDLRKSVGILLAFGFPCAWLIIAKVSGVLSFLGVSYMSFRLSRLVMEVSDDEIKAPNLSEYLSYAFFVPTFLLGPISKYESHSLSYAAPDKSWANFFRGFARISVGAIKIFVLASVIYQISLPAVIEDGREISWIEFYLLAITFFIYIYTNFSGAADISIGAGAVIGIKVDENFDNPLASSDVRDFWNRWHITLSDWIKDLIYTPLTLMILRNFRRVPAHHAVTVPILVAFILIGVWHGNGWNFFLLGLFHAIGVLVSHYVRHYTQNLNQGEGRNKLLAIASKGLGIFLTLSYVSLVSTLLLFDIGQYGDILQKVVR